MILKCENAVHYLQRSRTGTGTLDTQVESPHTVRICRLLNEVYLLKATFRSFAMA